MRDIIRRESDPTMIPAYDETYLPDAMANLAGAFDYALNDCGLPVGLFMDFFATSEAAALFGRGTPKYVSWHVRRGAGGRNHAANRLGAHSRYAASRTARRLNTRILGRMGTRILPMGQGSAVLGHSRCAVARRYRATAPTLHEADESRFVDVYDERAAHNRTEGDSRLHTIRVRAGLSQSGLARRSGVTLRSIQMYEQRRKDLGKAAVSTVLALARTLGCRIEDLLEP
mgnify:CR=1 FL=1